MSVAGFVGMLYKYYVRFSSEMQSPCTGFLNASLPDWDEGCLAGALDPNTDL